MTTRNWTKGDRVIHTGKPEWGSGDVVLAEPATHEGQPCQRLTIRFDRGGLKTISTAFAKLSESEGAAISEHAPPADDPLARAHSEAEVAEVLAKLPEPATDPFTSLAKRFEATLGLYRFTESGGSLLDWASVQTGLKDPLARFNRHELERHFARFRIELDNHLKKIARDLRRQDPKAYDQLASAARPSARDALRRADIGR